MNYFQSYSQKRIAFFICILKVDFLFQLKIEEYRH